MSADRRGPISRRGLFGAATGVVAGAAVVGAGRALAGPPESEALATPGTSDRHPQVAGETTIPFYGRHQAGITTPTQRCSSFAAFDVTTPRRQDLAELLQRWTRVAANLCAGRTAAPLTATPDAVEPDSGAALGLGPARLTVNFGFGPSLFGIGGPDRFGLRARWPIALVDLPRFSGDLIQPADNGGDLTVHACADDPQVAFHAVRQLTRSAGGDAAIRWAQSAYSEAPVTAGTPRNLLGFKDGTVNPATDHELDAFVWVDAGQDQAWMAGGTYLVVRRIRMLLDRWDSQTLASQERVIGRHKVSGAPLGGHTEFEPLDLNRREPDARPLIAADAHVRLASPQENWGQMLLRRSFSYDNGATLANPTLPGEVLDAGVFFCAYQQNPRLAFIPMYESMSTRDALRPFTIHTASAIAAVPPGIAESGHSIGDQLLA